MQKEWNLDAFGVGGRSRGGGRRNEVRVSGQEEKQGGDSETQCTNSGGGRRQTAENIVHSPHQWTREEEGTGATVAVEGTAAHSEATR
ncbi:hypothetical protein HN873_052498, partial [Arachis hypogaea]